MFSPQPGISVCTPSSLTISCCLFTKYKVKHRFLCEYFKIYPSEITAFSSYFSEFYWLQISYYTIIYLNLSNLPLHCEHNHDRAITSNCLSLQVSWYIVNIWRNGTELSHSLSNIYFSSPLTYFQLSPVRNKKVNNPNW